MGLLDWFRKRETKEHAPPAPIRQLKRADGLATCGKCKCRVSAFNTYADGSVVCLACCYGASQ